MLTLMLGLLGLGALLSSVVLFIRQTNFEQDYGEGARGAPYRGAQHIYQEILNQMARQHNRSDIREAWRDGETIIIGAQRPAVRKTKSD